MDRCGYLATGGVVVEPQCPEMDSGYRVRCRSYSTTTGPPRSRWRRARSLVRWCEVLEVLRLAYCDTAIMYAVSFRKLSD